MIVIEGLKDGPVKGEVCVLTLFGEGDVIQHFEDKSVIVGKWKALEPCRLIDADDLALTLENTVFNDYYDYNLAMEAVNDAPTVLEASE